MNSYDVETFKKNGTYVPFCVCFILNEKKYNFYYKDSDDIITTSIETIFEVIKKETVMYIHNIKFDSSFIISSISQHNKYKITCVIENRQVYCITLGLEEKKIIFRCSYKLLPLSLQNIANGFNIGKKIDYPYAFIDEFNIFHNNEISAFYFKTSEGFKLYNQILDLKKFTIRYCFNDCLLTKKFIEIIYNIFMKEFKIDILSKNILSTPSLSYYVFYQKFNKKKIAKKVKKDIELYIRDSYFGGRCEVFGNPLNDERLYHFDFSGMYGLCMKEQNVYGEPQFYYNIENADELEPGFYNID